jgi:hypothetical protein
VFFNEADTLESSSILLYSFQEQIIYTQNRLHEAILIKTIVIRRWIVKVTSLQLINQEVLIKGGNKKV